MSDPVDWGKIADVVRGMLERGDVDVAPLLMTPRQASTYIGWSEAKLKMMRLDDEQRLSAGEQIQGPRWLRISERKVRYHRDDLRDYAERLRAEKGLGVVRGWKKIRESRGERLQ